MPRHRLDTVEDYVIYGDALAARAKPAPAALKAPVTAFLKMHATYTKAARDVDRAKDGRDRAISSVNAADAVLDGRVLTLADVLVAAGIGSRIKPFARFIALPPSKLVELPYKTEMDQVRRLVAGILELKPDAKVRAACSACSRAADAVERALGEIPATQAAYVRAIGVRDALRPEWSKRLMTLRKHAAVVWDGDAASFHAFFDGPARITAPTRKRAKKAAPRVEGQPTA